MTSTTIILRPELAGLGADDERTHATVQELVDDLRSVEIPPSAQGRPRPGTKGELTDLVISLGGSTAVVGAAVRVFHLWLSRDRRRSLTLTTDRGDGRRTVVEISGDAVSDETVREAMRQLLEDEPDEPGA
ncbi:effector-associated constant component EACC1 [Actinoplanes sp. HUAS TT8]|uniref:effector-associated constant component EACC1 n=1 Tax=Actinoplanes sp. HUAS TT8 TaxID=3447453 RepID=UPI003F52500D